MFSATIQEEMACPERLQSMRRRQVAEAMYPYVKRLSSWDLQNTAHQCYALHVDTRRIEHTSPTLKSRKCVRRQGITSRTSARCSNSTMASLDVHGTSRKFVPGSAEISVASCS